MIRNSFRTPITIVGFSIAVIVVGTRVMGRMYPILPGTIALATVSLLIIQFWRRSFTYSYLFCYVFLSVFYRLFGYLYPASFIAADSDGYAFHITRLLTDHSVSSLPLRFYREANVFLITGQVSTIISGGSIKVGIAFPAVIVGILFPLSAYLLPQYLPVSDTTKISYLATSLVVMAPSSIALVINPIPQTQSAVISLTVILLLGMYVRDRHQLFLILSVFCLFVVLWTHKLAPFVLAAGLVLSASTSALFRNNGYSNFNTLFALIGSSLITGIYIRDAIFTQFDRAVVFRTLALVGIKNERGGVTQGFETEAAVPITESSILTVLLNVGYHLPLFVLAGAGWLLLLLKGKSDPFVRLVLFIVGFGTGLTIASTLNFVSGGPIRFLFPIIPMVSVLIACVVIYIINIEKPITRQTISGYTLFTSFIILLMILLISGQAISLTASSDSSLQPRSYLNSPEIESKVWGDLYVQSEIVTDDFYANEMAPKQLRKFAKRGPEPPSKYKGRNEWVINGTVARNAECFVALRPNVYQYGYAGRWKLTQQVTTGFDEYRKLYSSGQNGATIYARYPMSRNCSVSDDVNSRLYLNSNSRLYYRLNFLDTH